MIYIMEEKFSEQRKKDKSKSINRTNNNLCTNNKTKQEIDFFITGPGTEADREASSKTI